MSEFIRLTDAKGEIVLDSISVEYEDSFCLESFKDLIHAAQKMEPKGTKHFIIARVQTWDPKQPDKAFYSYYHAHHLNKILFQTQIYLDKKLIHRLRVLNPLTNSDIIGNVLYFMVKNETKTNPDVSLIQKSDIIQSSQRSPATLKVDVGLKPLPGSIPPASPSVSNIPKLDDPIAINRLIHNQAPTDKGKTLGAIAEEVESKPISPIASPVSLIDGVRSIANNGWTLGDTSTSILGDEEDVDMIDPIKKSKRTSRGAYEMNPRMSKTFTSTSAPVNPIALSIITNGGKLGAPLSAQVESKQKQMYNGPLSANAGFQEWIINSPKQTTNSTFHGSNVLVVPGQITQHGQILTPEQLSPIVNDLLKKNRRRSYLNSIEENNSTNLTTTTFSFSTVKPSVGEWANMMIKEKEVTPKEETSTNNLMGIEDQVKYIDAVLIATDNDFLESGKIRAIFRENEVVSGDAALFEMKPFTGETPQTDADDLVLPCECCFPSEARIREMPILLRLFHKHKCNLLVILIVSVIIMIVATKPLK